MRLRLVTSLLVVTAVAGCLSPGPVNELYVRNQGDRVWMIRYPIPYERSAGMFWVNRILPGADGVAGRWAKQPPENAQVEILGPDCEPVAAFRPTATAYSPPEAPGLEVTVTPWGSHMHSWNTPEIVGPVEECGGSPGWL